MTSPASTDCCLACLDGLAPVRGRLHGRLARLLDLAQHGAHLSHRLLGLLGQALDLLRDDGEALAVVAGLGGLDGGVHRQQVGLLGQVVDRGDDVARGLGPSRSAG